jgi:HupE / UreJ protein
LAYLILEQKSSMKVKKIFLVLIILLSYCEQGKLFAHPMPNSMVILKVHEKHISGELQLPLGELQLAIGMSVNDNSKKLIERLGDSLRIYVLKHLRSRTLDGKFWAVTIGKMKVVESNNQLTGNYKELVIDFEMSPPQNYDLRNFYFDYDVILHQVASHKVLVAVKQDWQQGIVSESGSPHDGSPPDGSPPDSTMQQVGVIAWDIPTNTISPFQISLQAGSNWQGFKNMVTLGISHIWEGTDHILFILTLLLPSMLLAHKKRWAEFMGAKKSLINLLKIITAFTIGHSLTLLLGSVHWINLPTKPIEIFIAITILISAFHAYRPIYPKKEVLIAGSFGLIHGLAFAETLTNLQLSTKQMFLSILGFNIGIELMQLMIIILVFPILILLNKTRYYAQIRQIGAIIMMILAFAWMVERIQEKPNFITSILP